MEDEDGREKSESGHGVEGEPDVLHPDGVASLVTPREIGELQPSLVLHKPAISSASLLSSI